MMTAMSDVMAALARERAVFHSEADFQHALAWALQTFDPCAKLRLEFRPFPEEHFYLDIWLESRSESVAIELKYLTRRHRTRVNGEPFVLNNHGAQPLRRYDFVKDLARLERITLANPKAVGYAILLTNDSSYWTRSLNSLTIDSAFRLHENRTLTGRIAWSDAAGQGTTKGREDPLTLQESYHLNWVDYSIAGEGTASTFRYLLVKVEARAAPLNTPYSRWS